ncbi:MAG: GNAT family N-acetyltransferase [Ruminococcaceae bacterium]|nr:GNAT family N-acetyltransferase [Oscillospiraceae bacterium]
MIYFKKATYDDLPTLAATRQKVWATTYRGIYADEMIDHFDHAWHIARDRRRMEDPKQDFYLVMDDDVCVGYFYFGTPHVDYKDFTFCLNSLYFLREYRGRGLGRRVFNFVRSVCRERGIDKFFNGCNVHNLPAQGFYRKMGGVVGKIDDGHTNKAEDQMYFEYNLGEEI